MRTPAEIRARIEHIQTRLPGVNDLFGVRVQTLEKALGQTEEQVRADALDYMDFALDKATGHKGLSALRSVERFQEWVWLLGTDGAYWHYAGIDYAPYGMPKLKVAAVALHLTEPWKRHEEYEGDLMANMAAGKACRPKCDAGCYS